MELFCVSERRRLSRNPRWVRCWNTSPRSSGSGRQSCVRAASRSPSQRTPRYVLQAEVPPGGPQGTCCKQQSLPEDPKVCAATRYVLQAEIPPRGPQGMCCNKVCAASRSPSWRTPRYVLQAEVPPRRPLGTCCKQKSLLEDPKVRYDNIRDTCGEQRRRKILDCEVQGRNSTDSGIKIIRVCPR